MNAEQIENWRKVLFRMYGPYAFFMTDEQIQMFKDRMQLSIDRLAAQDDEPQECTCDPKREGRTVHQDGSVECNKCHKTRAALAPQPGVIGEEKG
jgi:hypothetical protein